VLLAEGVRQNLPRAGHGESVGGRRQIECGRSPEQYLGDLPRREVGLTPEAYILAFLDALEHRGQVLDAQDATYLLGAYALSSRYVPSVYWSRVLGQTGFDWIDPAFLAHNIGARVEVRVV
jgi:hypothetical protein